MLEHISTSTHHHICTSAHFLTVPSSSLESDSDVGSGSRSNDTDAMRFRAVESAVNDAGDATRSVREGTLPPVPCPPLLLVPAVDADVEEPELADHCGLEKDAATGLAGGTGDSTCRRIVLA